MLLFSAPRLLPERSCTQAFLACVYVAVQHCPSSAVADIVLLQCRYLNRGSSSSSRSSRRPESSQLSLIRGSTSFRQCHRLWASHPRWCPRIRSGTSTSTSTSTWAMSYILGVLLLRSHRKSKSEASSLVIAEAQFVKDFDIPDMLGRSCRRPD